MRDFQLRKLCGQSLWIVLEEPDDENQGIQDLLHEVAEVAVANDRRENDLVRDIALRQLWNELENRTYSELMSEVRNLATSTPTESVAPGLLPGERLAAMYERLAYLELY